MLIGRRLAFWSNLLKWQHALVYDCISFESGKLPKIVLYKMPIFPMKMGERTIKFPLTQRRIGELPEEIIRYIRRSAQGCPTSQAASRARKISQRFRFIFVETAQSPKMEG